MQDILLLTFWIYSIKVYATIWKYENTQVFSLYDLKCNNVEHKNSRVVKLEKQVLALIKEKYGEVEVKPKEKISIKDIEKKIEKLQAKKMSVFEKYKLGKMTKVVESKKQIDKEINRLEEKIKLSSNETEVVTDNELTRELMEKYVESGICEGSIVQKIIWK